MPHNRDLSATSLELNSPFLDVHAVCIVKQFSCSLVSHQEPAPVVQCPWEPQLPGQQQAGLDWMQQLSCGEEQVTDPQGQLVHHSSDLPATLSLRLCWSKDSAVCSCLGHVNRDVVPFSTFQRKAHTSLAQYC